MYAWRTRKPHAFFGLPFVGRHWAYVGETSSRWHRDQQHIAGQPWADLDPKPYALFSLFPHVAWCRKAQETLWTLILWPVYPQQKNGWNPRRITRDAARRMRAQRDSNGFGFNLGRLVARLVAVVLFWTVLVYSAYQVWGQS